MKRIEHETQANVARIIFGNSHGWLLFSSCVVASGPDSIFHFSAWRGYLMHFAIILIPGGGLLSIQKVFSVNNASMGS